MDAQTVLRHLQAEGFYVGLDSGSIEVAPRSRLTNELCGAIRCHRPQLIQLLSAEKLGVYKFYPRQTYSPAAARDFALSVPEGPERDWLLYYAAVAEQEKSE